jgi:hypothetical protein
VAKDHTKDIVVIEPYRYDLEVSLRNLYLAIIMHEYPFIIVEHEYFVENEEEEKDATDLDDMMDVNEESIYGCGP